MAQPRVLAKLVVTISTPAIVVGQTATIAVAGFDEQGAAMSIGVPAWSSSEPGIATVSADGVVTAVGPGSATVIARIGTVQGGAALAVAPLPPGPAPVASVVVSPVSASLPAGRSLQLTATPKNAAGQDLAGRAVTWATSASEVATVTATGMVTTIAEGTALIEATCDGQRGALALTVTVAVDTEIVVTIAVPAGQLTIGDTLLIVATARSPEPIVSVVAAVGGQQLMLAYGPIGNGSGLGWMGTMDVSSLRFGAYVVTVTATDSRGQHNLSTVTIVRDPRLVGGGKSPFGSKQRQPGVPPTIP